MFKRLFTWKGRINRREFIITFILGIVLIHMFAYLANVEFYQHYPYGNLKFNVNLSFFYSFAILGVVFGVIPLLIFNLYSMNKLVIQWNGVYGTEFLPLMIAVDILFVLYIFQCFKRCHDIEYSGLYCLIPLWNPFALLFCRGDKGKNMYDLEEESEDENNERERERLMNEKTDYTLEDLNFIAQDHIFDCIPEERICIGDTLYHKAYANASLRGRIPQPENVKSWPPCPYCGKKSEELLWYSFKSLPDSWRKLRGREGKLAVCPNCHRPIVFGCECMN